MGIVNAGQLDVYDEIDSELLERIEDVLFMRHPDATERLVTVAGQYQSEGPAEGRNRCLARGHGAGTPAALSGEGNRRPHRRRHRGSTTIVWPTDRGDRGPAHGRYECGRRSVRRRQDVLAAGCQERARDETRRRTPGALSRGRKGRRRSRQPGRPRSYALSPARCCWPP